MAGYTPATPKKKKKAARSRQKGENNILKQFTGQNEQNGMNWILVEPGSVVISQAEQERRREYWEHEQEKQRQKDEKRERREQCAKWRNNKPKFFFASAENGYDDIKAETAARLFYLGAHMTYGGKLQKEQKPILRGDLHKVAEH